MSDPDFDETQDEFECDCGAEDCPDCHELDINFDEEL